MGYISETEIYAAFVRMYNNLKPALAQLNDPNVAPQRENPAMLAVNRTIADISEQSYKITTLQTWGLLDADV